MYWPVSTEKMADIDQLVTAALYEDQGQTQSTNHNKNVTFPEKYIGSFNISQRHNSKIHRVKTVLSKRKKQHTNNKAESTY